MIDTDTTRCLPVTMTAEECATKALQLATLCGEIAAAEVKAKELAADAKSAIKALEGDRDQLAYCVRTGKEHRTVDVYKRMNLSLRTWEIRRADTTEIVESKAMTEYEYREATQEKLPFHGTRADSAPTRLTTALAEADAAIDQAVDGILARQRARGMTPLDTDQPGGQEIPEPKPAKALTATVAEIAAEPPCINANCGAPITNKAQARAGRCGACAKYWRVKGEERPRKGPLVVDESGADA